MTRKMKESGVEWIGEIPEVWDVRKIKHICKVKGVVGHPDEEVLSLYRELGIVIKSKRDDNFNRTSENTDNYKFVEINDLVVNKMKAWQGSIAVSKFQGIVSPAYYVCTFYDDDVFPFYIHYLLRSVIYHPEYRRLSGGIRPNQWDLSIDNFRHIPIILPPPSIQHAISSYLDTKCSLIDSTIEKEREIIDKLKEYRQAVITEAVTKGIRPGVPMKDSGVEWIGEIPEGWDVQKIKSYYSIVNGSTPKSDKSEYWGGDIIWITPAEMSASIVEIYDSKRTITEDGLQSCGTTLLPMNSIILSTRAPIGQVCIAGTSLCTNQGCKSLVMRAEFNYKYSYYYLSSQTVTLNMLGRGTTFMELSSYDLANYPLPIPPLPEQQEIADYLDAKCSAIDATIQKRELAIEKLTAYKQSLIYECVTGKREVFG